MKYNHKRNICLFIVMIQILTCPIMAAGVAQKKSNDLTYTNTAQLEQQIARRIGVSSQQVDALMDRGYMLEEIEHMTPEIVDSILTVGLTAEELASYYRTRNGSSADALTATDPSGYTKGGTVLLPIPSVRRIIYAVNGAKILVLRIGVTKASICRIVQFRLQMYIHLFLDMFRSRAPAENM